MRSFFYRTGRYLLFELFEQGGEAIYCLAVITALIVGLFGLVMSDPMYQSLYPGQ